MPQTNELFNDSISIISLIIPFLVVILLILNSIINTNIKGIIYFIGVLLLTFIIKLYGSTITGTDISKGQRICKLLNINGVSNNTISLSTAILSFTFTYLFIPMLYYNSFNMVLLLFIIISSIIDIKVKMEYECENNVSILLGNFIGIMVGILFFTFIYTIGKDSKYSLIYYDDFISNKVACSRPTKQKFQCKVYKNGELLRTI